MYSMKKIFWKDFLCSKSEAVPSMAAFLKNS